MLAQAHQKTNHLEECSYFRGRFEWTTDSLVYGFVNLKMTHLQTQMKESSLLHSISSEGAVTPQSMVLQTQEPARISIYRQLHPRRCRLRVQHEHRSSARLFNWPGTANLQCKGNIKGYLHWTGVRHCAKDSLQADGAT